MRLSRDRHHLSWDSRIEPAAYIESGQELEVELANSSGGQLHPGSRDADLLALDFTRVNPVTGPIYVRGAAPGDGLKVTILDIALEDWGWTANIPGFGLLAEDFPDPRLVLSRVRGDEVEVDIGACLPLTPMIGTLGVAHATPGPHSLVPPTRFGGNMDIRHLSRGSTVLLPVAVEGALLSLGDTHAAMGDGEVCGTGVETASVVRLSVEVVPGAAPPFPVLQARPGHRSGDALVTTGIGPDLQRCARDATRGMVDIVVARTGIAPVDAYLLCSLTGDLVISEIVDVPHWVVTMHLPLPVLGTLARRPA
ncbi:MULTISPECIES: acetamidase/formamidase family protein [Micromonospora]|uniref:Acetamidase n=1 Tax=Micromonospora sicca TaxID=2202420 RepID=A0A317DKN4_9ACTN|nr:MULTISPECIES: acetamidase/formamidase family protein [unclassified Micromonospora]MBM0226731.1 acetamidase/formamidase family protein [Micromonospora sp. ATA51]PWR15339.1 acetamidase [Micromonospora sp. 4G51]